MKNGSLLILSCCLLVINSITVRAQMLTLVVFTKQPTGVTDFTKH